MTSDRGSQFMSNLWTTIAKLLGTRLHHTTAYLRARLTNHNWLDELPWVLLGIRTAPKVDLNCSSAELVYGSPLTVPGDFIANSQGMHDSSTILPQLRDTVSKFVSIPSTMEGIGPLFHLTCRAVNTCFHPFIRRDAHRTPLQRPYKGPFHVLERNSISEASPILSQLITSSQHIWISATQFR